MKSEHYPYTLAALLLGLLLAPRAPYAQSMYQVDPFAAAAAPFDQLNPAALTTGLLAERAARERGPRPIRSRHVAVQLHARASPPRQPHALG